MKTFTHLIKLSLIVAGILSIALTAQDMQNKGLTSFKVLDENRDGFISKSEFSESRMEIMSQKQNQGMPMKNAESAPTFNFFDVDKNGKISKLELQEGQNRQMLKNRANTKLRRLTRLLDKPTFESFDLNDDGHLNGREVHKARDFREKEVKAQGKMVKDYCDQTPFSEIDLDGDNKVTKEEFIKNQMKKNK
ncbi:MAG: EF-hand domain-containing protein [Sulfurimonas sp.]|jgi:Ca2+-binding EF-hand superfamily protein|nr:EF-hand domain-containing protein [Sulfurimonas sp.]